MQNITIIGEMVRTKRSLAAQYQAHFRQSITHKKYKNPPDKTGYTA